MFYEDAQDAWDLYSISPELTCTCDQFHTCQQCDAEEEKEKKEVPQRFELIDGTTFWVKDNGIYKRFLFEHGKSIRLVHQINEELYKAAYFSALKTNELKE